MRNRLFACAVVFTFLAGFAAVRGQGVNDEQAVRAVFKEMVDADLTGNADELERNTREDFTVTRDNGVVRSRAETLDGIRSGATKFSRFDVSDLRVRVYGETALVTFTVAIKGSRAGQEFSGRFREVRLFVKRDGKWKAEFLQRTAIAGAASGQ